MSIRVWFVIIINGILVIVVTVLSLLFYKQFKESLDERVLLQLSSIKNLKRIHIENYFDEEFDRFKSRIAVGLEDPVNDHLAFFKENGIYDLSLSSKDSTALVVMVVKLDQLFIDTIDFEKVQEILLERTGMGSSGETYLVGKDFRMRSLSRFFPEKKPLSILADTPGVHDALSGKNNSEVIKDYREVMVYSSYDKINVPNLNWAILSEIDQQEIMIPLREMRIRLRAIAIIIILITSYLSIWLSKFFSDPLRKAQHHLRNMAQGKYDNRLSWNAKQPIEIQEMFVALEQLKDSLEGAISFSADIGNMDLGSTYIPKHAEDVLGHSLLRMRDKLVEYRKKEHEGSLLAKRMLLEGQETERTRLARELHDGIGPLLTSLKLYIESEIVSKEKKQEIKKVLDSTIDEIRRMTYALMPPSLVDFGIGEALENFVSLMARSSDLEIEFQDMTKHESTAIPSNLSVAIFRICQELVNNSIKHSQASKVVITLTEFDNHVSLFFFDNGNGFDIKKITLGAGIINIKERIDAFSGSIEFNANPGNFTVEVEIPLKT